MNTPSSPPQASPLNVDILCVGAGVASLSTALALLRCHKKTGGGKPPPRVVVLEKSRSIGNHVLSGAVIDPAAFEGLLNEEEIRRLPVEAHVTREAFRFLAGARVSLPIPWVPSMMRAHGFPIGSLSRITRYLAMLCEAEGAEIYCGFAVTEWLEDETGRIIGARTGPRGMNRSGQPKSNYAPSEEIRARAIVLGEGACGYLAERLIASHGMAACRPQTYALGVKELVEIPKNEARRGEILHTFGYPAATGDYGGGFVYHISATEVMVGYVYGLDYSRPETDIHALFRRYKAHPAIASHMAGGKVVAYGAKAIPEGGLFSVPNLVTDGALVVGDSGGLLDSLRIKGIHMAMQSGRLAGETLAAAWRAGDFGVARLAAYERALRDSPVWRQLQRVRNVRASFSKHMALGVAAVGCAWLTRGILPWWKVSMEPDPLTLRPARRGGAAPFANLEVSLVSPDRLTDVFLSGTIHEEDQPCHLLILDREKCAECITRYGAPCQHFCPAEVYRLEEGQIRADFSNCVHCKTCQIKDPYANIRWTPPTGGDGPRYTRL